MANDKNQDTLFDLDELSKCNEHWKNMPEYNQQDLTPYKQLIVSFENEADYKAFGQLVGQKLTYKTRSIWYPEAEIGRMTDKLFIDESGEIQKEA